VTSFNISSVDKGRSVKGLKSSERLVPPNPGYTPFLAKRGSMRNTSPA